MQISPRLEYLIYSTVCALNAVTMLFAFFGEAATGSGVKPLLWPPGVLFVIGILLLAAFSASRAAQVGQSGWMAALATILLCGLGPIVFALIAYLAALPEKDGFALAHKQATPTMIGIQAATLLLLPWGLLLIARSVWLPG
ncbi:MAG: hypothetical protein M3O62_01225 [Pseudomonadota bacterium]|nr:hypothetical protein [Pseudomonadota bacterium]